MFRWFVLFENILSCKKKTITFRLHELITLYHQLENPRTSNLQGESSILKCHIYTPFPHPAILIKLRVMHNISADGSLTTCVTSLFSRRQARGEQGAPDTRDGIRLPPSRVPHDSRSLRASFARKTRRNSASSAGWLTSNAISNKKGTIQIHFSWM